MQAVLFPWHIFSFLLQSNREASPRLPSMRVFREAGPFYKKNTDFLSSKDIRTELESDLKCVQQILHIPYFPSFVFY